MIDVMMMNDHGIITLTELWTSYNDNHNSPMYLESSIFFKSSLLKMKTMEYYANGIIDVMWCDAMEETEWIFSLFRKQVYNSKIKN
jgi:hypothetical protein